MTPTHQQLVDDILVRMHNRTRELMQSCLPALKNPLPEAPRELLQDTPLGKHLAAIAHYEEGYPYPYQGDVRASIDFLAHCLYGDPLAPQGFRLPQKWQRSPLGALVHSALLHFFEEERPDSLLTVTDLRTRFGVKRQSVHQWVDDGLLFAVYRGDTPLFYSKDVERFQQVRARKQRDNTTEIVNERVS